MNDEERIAAITPRDRELNDWAFRSFRNIGDGDYVAARMAYRGMLLQQFLWSSQQALEKYLKCILFIRRIPAKGLKHVLQPALKLIEDNRVGLELTERSKEFIARIDRMGRFRYMEVSVFVDWRWIVSLDQAVWEVRRFCTLDPKVTAHKLVDGKWAPRVEIVAGHLERILENRENPARSALLWNNAYFGRGRKTAKSYGGLSAVNSPLFQKAYLLDDVLKYAYIPKDVEKAYRDHAAAAATKAKKAKKP
jgi:hypothetical protein